jgi:hypothetical protein
MNRKKKKINVYAYVDGTPLRASGSFRWQPNSVHNSSAPRRPRFPKRILKRTGRDIFTPLQRTFLSSGFLLGSPAKGFYFDKQKCVFFFFFSQNRRFRPFVKTGLTGRHTRHFLYTYTRANKRACRVIYRENAVVNHRKTYYPDKYLMWTRTIRAYSVRYDKLFCTIFLTVLRERERPSPTVK